MGAMKRRMEDIGELAMMGCFVPIKHEEAEPVARYIMTCLGYDLDIDVDARLRRYNKSNEVTHIGTCRVYGMPCIVFCVDTHDGETPKPFEEDYGSGYPCAFSYVLNLAGDDTCSEWGDCFFEKRGGYYHKVS